jgi:hypothetical protein
MPTRPGRTGGRIAALLCGLALAGLLPEHGRAGPYEIDVLLAGTPETTRVSGYRGTALTLDVDDDEQAIYGISSAERRDNPCWILVSTEDVNDSANSTGAMRDLCGATPGSRTMRAVYRDDMYFGQRVFVTGIRVCTNNRETRVKGFQLRGKRIEDDGGLATLTYPPGSTTYRLASGRLSDRGLHQDNSQNPADYRNNCREWHAWAECPQSHQVATGLIAHFEAGTTPRSLTGVQLQCRNVVQSHSGATRK